eukprot:6473971-Amphidinium_carterae.5
MMVNLKKTVVICNGAKATRLLMKVWRKGPTKGRFPPPCVTTRDLGVDTQWAAWRRPVQRKRVVTFGQSMLRVRSLGLQGSSKARIAKSLYSVGLHGVQVGGQPSWDTALERGHGRGPIRHLRLLADRLGWVPRIGGCTQDYRHLKKSSARVDDKSGMKIVFRCPHWHKERPQLEPPTDNETVLACVKLHGLLPAPRLPAMLTLEPALSVHRAELLAVVRALEECQPREVVNDCKGVVKAVQALQTGRNRDLEKRALHAHLPGQQLKWMKAHLKQVNVDSGRITADGLHGNGQADALANQGTDAHGPLEPNALPGPIAIGLTLRTRYTISGVWSFLNSESVQKTNHGSGYWPKLWTRHLLWDPKEWCIRRHLSR